MDLVKIETSKDLECLCSVQARAPRAGRDITHIIIIVAVTIIVIINIIFIIVVVIIVMGLKFKGPRLMTASVFRVPVTGLHLSFRTESWPVFGNLRPITSMS